MYVVKGWKSRLVIRANSRCLRIYYEYCVIRSETEKSICNKMSMKRVQLLISSSQFLHIINHLGVQSISQI